jgi:hypothetical protein
MIAGKKVETSFFASFPCWNFLSLDSQGRSGGIIVGWRKSSIKFINSWAYPYILYTHFFSNEHNFEFVCINVYKPYSDKKYFWQSFFNKDLLQHSIIIDEDLNFTLGDYGGPRLKDTSSPIFSL